MKKTEPKPTIEVTELEPETVNPIELIKQAYGAIEALHNQQPDQKYVIALEHLRTALELLK